MIISTLNNKIKPRTNSQRLYYHFTCYDSVVACQENSPHFFVVKIRELLPEESGCRGAFCDFRGISLQTTYPEFFVKGSLRELAMPLKKRIMKGYNFAGKSKGGTERNERIEKSRGKDSNCRKDILSRHPEKPGSGNKTQHRRFHLITQQPISLVILSSLRGSPGLARGSVPHFSRLNSKELGRAFRSISERELGVLDFLT